MKPLVIFALLLFSIYLYIDHKRPVDCSALKQDQYTKRQRILARGLEQCQSNESCLSSLYDLSQTLRDFDRQVLLSEGCK